MAELIDGAKIAEEILADLKSKVSILTTAGIFPRLIVVLVGENPASLSYIRVKQKRAAEIGFAVDIQKFPETISQAELQSSLMQINREPNVAGILVQLPLPQHLDRQVVLDTVKPELDVDCLTSINKQVLLDGQERVFIPPAAAAVLKILEIYKADYKRANMLIVGSGDLVGKPLATLFLRQKVDFRLANRHTENLPELARQADIIITGVGKPGLITGDMVKQGSMVIDAGTAASEQGDVRGDVEVASVAKKAAWLAAVPGGVGPVTVAMLLRNAVMNAFDLFLKKA